ncbi:hotdog fold thioesterase [Vibrio stylophorae]|uniref:hotdog fold thioesterase n=1 Tax=Vibrio stylophorae TaxID=659351 RepID=UPI001F01E1F9|nr:hotdog fold thioesterase [Vibrio stylophorae]
MWKKPVNLDVINGFCQNTLVSHLQIEFTAIGENSLTATMPVAPITHQPLGILHGGASVVLAETIGSVAANMAVADPFYCVGLDINANHVRAKRDGVVTGIATPVHLGATTQVWQIEIVDEQQHTICVSRLTMAVLKHKRAKDKRPL